MSVPGRPTVIRILHRYFVREFVGPSAAALGLYTFIMLINQLFLLVDYAYKYDVPLSNLGRLFLLQLPHILVLTLPMAFLVGLLVATARWAADSELVALSASGHSISLLLRPVLATAFLLTLATAWLAFDVMPRGNRAIGHEVFEIFRSNLFKNLRQREFTTRLLSNASLYINEIESGETGDMWNGVILDPGATGGDRREVFFARKAVPSVDADANQLVLTLVDVTVHGWMQNNPTVYDVRTLKTFTQVLPPPPLVRRPEGEPAGSNRSVREMTLPELLAQRDLLPSSDLALARLTEVEIHKRLAIPFACLVFAVLGLGVGATARRSGTAFGFLFSLVVFLAYYQAFYAGERLAVTGDLPPWLAMWGGNILSLAVGGFFFHQRATEGRMLHRIRRVVANLGLGPWLRRFNERRSARRVALARQPQMGRSRRSHGLPSILDRYVFVHFLQVLALVLGSAVAIYIQVTLFQYLDDIFRNNISLGTVVRLYIAWMPEILTYVLPMSVLVTTVISLGLLARNNEVTAMLVNGVSLRRVVAPVLAAALGLTAFTFVLYDRWLPRSAERYFELDQRVKGIPPRTNFAPARWVPLVGGHRFLYYNAFDRSRDLFFLPAVYELDPESFSPQRLVAARRARWADYRLHLVAGTERTFRSHEDPVYAAFDEMELPFLEQRPGFARDWKEPKYMTYDELVAYIDWKKEHESEARELVIELRNKRAYPFVTLVMALLGLPFAFSIGRRGSLHGVGIAIVLAAVYWSAVVFSTYLGKLGALPPEIAAWSPNAVFGALGLAAFLNLRS